MAQDEPLNSLYPNLPTRTIESETVLMLIFAGVMVGIAVVRLPTSSFRREFEQTNVPQRAGLRYYLAHRAQGAAGAKSQESIRRGAPLDRQQRQLEARDERRHLDYRSVLFFRNFSQVYR